MCQNINPISVLFKNSFINKFRGTSLFRALPRMVHDEKAQAKNNKKPQKHLNTVIDFIFSI